MLIGELSEGKINHCATCCKWDEGISIAWYAGPRECSEEQGVYCVFWNSKNYSQSFLPRMRTGNPVLMDKTLIYSYFTRLDVGRRIVKRWKYCSNWVSPFNDELRDSTYRLPIQVGYLARCQAAKINNEWLLPLYREQDPVGLIMVYKENGKWEKRGTIERPAETRYGNGSIMQPTLWHDGNILHTLCRDVSRNGFAWYSQSEDLGRSWSDPIPSAYQNYNSSIVAIHDGGDNPLIIWNPERRRNKLSISYYKDGPNKPIIELDTNGGGYPNYCFDAKGRLHIVHSDWPNIKHHMFNADLSKPC